MPSFKTQIIKFYLNNASPSPDSPLPGSGGGTLPMGLIPWLPMVPAWLDKAVHIQPSYSAALLQLKHRYKERSTLGIMHDWELTVLCVLFLQCYSTQGTFF